MNNHWQTLIFWDDTITHRLRIAEKPGPIRTFAILFAHSADSWFWLLGLALVGMLGPREWRNLEAKLAIGIVVTALIVFIIKFAIRRQRPTGDWGEIYRKTDPHSFPSGHAARAAMLAMVCLAVGIHDLGLILFVWFGLVSLARVAMGVHYLLDVIAGGVLGILLGFILSLRFIF